jgi:protein TonB
MAASKAPIHVNNKRRRIIGFLLGIVIISGVVSLMMRTGEKKAPEEEFVIVDLTAPPPPPPPPEFEEPAEISEADAPDDIAEDAGEQIDLGIDAGDLASGPGGGGFLINVGRGGRGPGGGGGGGGLLDDVDSPPTPVSKIQPNYPSSLLKSGTGGRVLITCVVDETGKVVSSTVKQSAHPELDKAALAAVSKWKFKPASKAGRNVTAKCVVPFNFEVKKN